MSFDQLDTYIDHETLRVVIECPAGTALKARYDTLSGHFVASRELPLGISYPYDFGFVPGTLAEDGDPVDAIVLHASRSFSGLVMPCRIVGMVVFRQREGEGGKPVTNNRLVVTPAFADPLGSALADDVPERVRSELEQFFRIAVTFTDKHPVVSRWTGAAPAHEYLSRVLTKSPRPLCMSSGTGQ